MRRFLSSGTPGLPFTKISRFPSRIDHLFFNTAPGDFSHRVRLIEND